MPDLTVGKTIIPFEIRRSIKSKRRRIIVTPGKVEVVVPIRDNDDAILTFMHSRRQWVYDKREEIIEKIRDSTSVHPERFVTGAKILYRGRRMRLVVQTHRDNSIKVEYRNGFFIQRPENCSDIEVKIAIEKWLKDRVRSDVNTFIRHYSKKQAQPQKELELNHLSTYGGAVVRTGL